MDDLTKKIQMQQMIINNAHKYFLSKNFYPIATPKIVPFKDDEPDHLIKINVPGKENEELFLSRSPQFYKEIASLKTPNGKVYEIGGVFRGEPFSEGRRANEFLGLDVEIQTNDVNDVIFVLEDYILNLQNDKNLMDFLTQYYPNLNIPKNIIKILYNDAISILGSNEISVKEERKLSEIIRKENKDSWILLIGFPIKSRFFYKINEESGLTDSFDLISDWEICSGGLRRRDLDNYFKLLSDMDWSIKEFKYYADIINENLNINTGGFGIGLERLLGALINTIQIDEIQPYPRVPGKKIIF